MNLPNTITMGRFALALVLFGYLIYTDTCAGPSPWPPAIAGGAFILVVATDALDGYLARKLNQQTDFGRIADPVVDKILVCGALIFLASADWARDTLPVWVVVLIVSREFMVSGLRGFIESRGHAFPARWDGKLKMVLQCVVVPAVFLQRMLDLGWPGETTWVQVADAIAVGSIWLMFAVTLTSGARYVMAAATVLKAGSA
jgi:CDP-diacylglycerol--glycerol-3-phosphate 3-phosphatidyltransferase